MDICCLHPLVLHCATSSERSSPTHSARSGTHAQLVFTCDAPSPTFDLHADLFLVATYHLDADLLVVATYARREWLLVCWLQLQGTLGRARLFSPPRWLRGGWGRRVGRRSTSWTPALKPARSGRLRPGCWPACWPTGFRRTRWALRVLEGQSSRRWPVGGKPATHFMPGRGVRVRCMQMHGITNRVGACTCTRTCMRKSALWRRWPWRCNGCMASAMRAC
jgi:hypothetical protein